MTTPKLYSLSYTELKSYILAFAFVCGNIILPQICHMVPRGGFIFLPIYFFTLISSFKYGWRVGLLTATLSPLLNHLMFGMPPLSVLPAILTKSLLLVGAASLAAHYLKRKSVLILLGVVLSYQIIGTFIEWAIVKDFELAIQDFRIGVPGMAIQVIGGYLLIR